MPKKKSNNTINFYEVIEKSGNSTKPKYHNPNYGKTHMFKIPFRLLVIGGSGSGKTNTVVDIISKMSGTFNKIVLCIKISDEPLYNFLQCKAAGGMEIIQSDPKTGHIEIPNPDKYKGSIDQILFIFDDLVLEPKKTQEAIAQYFIRGRKIAGGISCIYITQSYYRTPKIIRINCNYIIIKKLSSVKDLKMILSEYNLNSSVQELEYLYKQATNTPTDFLLISTEASMNEPPFLKSFEITL